MAEQWLERALWGGAAHADLPVRLLDVSDFRPVPDQQEVFADGAADQSLVFEIVEHDAGVLDDAAARHFLEDLAICNKASTSEIIDVSTLGPTDVPGVPGTSFCCCVHGRQRIGKGRQDAASCGNTVDLLLAVVRLPHVASDLLVTLNTPVHIDPASASAADAGAGHKDAAHSGQLLRRVLHSFRIDDWGLFGEGDGHQ